MQGHPKKLLSKYEGNIHSTCITLNIHLVTIIVCMVISNISVVLCTCVCFQQDSNNPFLLK